MTIVSLRRQRVIAFVLPVVFMAVVAWRVWPLVDDVNVEGRLGGDDWHFYKRMALSILDGGLSMPGIHSYRLVPHGFLYNYFVAGVFAIFGANSAFVYLAQGLLLGIAVATLWLTATYRGTITAGAALLLCTATVFVDFTNRLSLRLLSENLFVFLAAIALWLIGESVRRRDAAFSAAAGAMLGLAVLSRTSAVAWALGVLLLGAWAAWRGQVRRGMWVAFAAAFAIAMCLLPLREYAAVGYPNFNAITHGGDWIRPPADLAQWPVYYGRRLLFMLGATPFLDPAYRPRPHWMVIWLGVAAYAITRVKWRVAPTGPEAAMLLLVPLYLGPVWLVAGVSNYGGRMVATAMPFAAFLAARWAGDYVALRRTGAGEATSS